MVTNEPLTRRIPEPRPGITAGEVVLARRAFIVRYWEKGSGWFKDDQTAGDMFDDLAEAGAFSDQWMREQAASMNERSL